LQIGILEADTLQADIREKYGSYADMFKQLFLSVDNRLTFKVYKVIEGRYPENRVECDAYVISGSKFSAYDNEPWILQLQKYIMQLHQHKIKLIGICFGHQIIAQALGGAVEKSKNGWGAGNMTSHIEHTKPWMSQPETQFSLLVSHQDQVISLPEQAERIAGSNFCENASFQIANHILTFQGHPEFSPDYLKYLVNKRRDILGDEKYYRAIDSLCQQSDAQLVAQWIIGFSCMQSVGNQ